MVHFLLVVIQKKVFNCQKTMAYFLILHPYLKHLYQEQKVFAFDKKNPQLSSAVVNGTFNPSANSALVIVDDVLNSGKTMMCALSVCFSKGFNQIQLAVLVDRSYKHFPLQANFIGTSLSTTLQEHINVQCRAGKISVYVE